MEEIFVWVKTIVYVVIFLTMAENVLPSASYRKYIHVFSGMILIMAVILPVQKLPELLLEKKQQLTMAKDLNQQHQTQKEEAIEDAGKKQEKLLESMDQSAVEQEILTECRNRWKQVEKIEVSGRLLEEGGYEIETITVGLTSEQGQEKKEEIKAFLEQNYGEGKVRFDP